jgi:putative membrane protein
VIIGLIVLTVRRFSSRPDTMSSPNALGILRERYAKGEIDEDEYERRKAKLES